MAQFFRKTEIVNDTGVFQAYPDLFIGQQDTMDIKGGTLNRRAILEFKVAEAPTFGDARLTAVRPNFYIDTFNLNESTELPRYKGYVFNQQLSDLSSPEGDLAIKDESAVVVHSVMDGNGTWLEEKFDSTPRQLMSGEVRLEVKNGTVSRILSEAIFVDELVEWIFSKHVTGGDGDPDRAWWNPARYGAIDLAEYSDDFDEHKNNGEDSLRQWLITNYAISADAGTTGFSQVTSDGSGVIANMLAGGTAGAVSGGAVGLGATWWSGGWGALPGATIGYVAGLVGGVATTDHDDYVERGSAFTTKGARWIIPLQHVQKSGQRDVYQPKNVSGGGAAWWVLSGRIDTKVKQEVEVISTVESELDEAKRIHPGNTIFDIVRRQKSHWIADPESYDETIEAVYTTALFKPSAGYDGQGLELKSHWRNIDSAEVAEKGLMIPMSAKDGETINNRQEILLSYGHIPRPNERDVYHAGTFDVDAEGAESAVASHNSFAGYESADETSRNTLIYEKMLDSKVATKVSFTTNLQDLEYAWAEARIDSSWAGDVGNSRCPKNSENGLISSRRGFFCTLSRNPVKQGASGEQPQTFTDYLSDNRTPVTDVNTGHSNVPGTYVLGFLNFPNDETVKDNDPDNYDKGGAPIGENSEESMGDLGYIHKQRQNKISVVWHDYWDSVYGEGSTNRPDKDSPMTHSIGWEINNNFNTKYQGIEGLDDIFPDNDEGGFFDIRWMGLANGPWDQPEDRMVLLEPDTFYTIDMYMHPKVPFVRVHITNTSTGKRVDGNKIQMWAGPYNLDSLQTIKAGINTDSGLDCTSNVEAGISTSMTTNGGTSTHPPAYWHFPVGSKVYASNGDVIGTVKASTKTLITFEGKAATDLDGSTTTKNLFYSVGNHVNSRMGDESRWPAYCSFWLNNTPWKSDNTSGTAFQGFEVIEDFNFGVVNGDSDNDPARGSPATCYHIDIFTGNTHKEGVHSESTVILDEFKITQVNTAKTFATVSKNNIKQTVGRLPVSSYSEVEGLFRPVHNFQGTGAFIQEPDADAAPHSSKGFTSIIMGNHGKGYDPEDPPTVYFGGGAGRGAKARVEMGTGTGGDGAGKYATDEVYQVVITDPGDGYSGIATVFFLGGGSPSVQATARAYIGTSRIPTEIVKTIQAPRYTSIGFDTIPSDMYTLYGNCKNTDSTTTKVMGGTDYSIGGTAKSMMSFDASGATTVTKVHLKGSVSDWGAGGGDGTIQINPQTAEFSSTTDNELIGGKLKIHYDTARTGEAGTSTAIRDIVRASNAATGPYVEVWPPLPAIPTDADDWEIQARSKILFNDLVTAEINNLDTLTTPDYDYARPTDSGNTDVSTIAPNQITRGVFNIGWAADMADIGGTSAFPSQTSNDTKDGITSTKDVTISGAGTAPKGGLECRYWDIDNTTSQGTGAGGGVGTGDLRQGMRTACSTNGNSADFEAPNGATKAIEVLRKQVITAGDLSPFTGPLGITRTFDTQIDLTDCDIMVIIRVPLIGDTSGGTGASNGTIMQIDSEADSGSANLQRLWAEPAHSSSDTGTGHGTYTGDGLNVPFLMEGPEYACSLRLYTGNQSHRIVSDSSADGHIGTWCQHKDNFMKKTEAAVYKPLQADAKTPANGHWIKLVFPTAGTAGLDKIKELTFALNATQHCLTKGANFNPGTGSTSGTGGQRMHIAGIHAIPRGTADVMAAFSSSENAIGELAKESFLSVDSGIHNRAKDGVHTTETGMTSGATSMNPKVSGLTIGGKGKINNGYLLGAAVSSTSATTITVDQMGTTAALRAIKVDDRLSFGTSTEILRVKTVVGADGASSTSITVERGADGTTATTHADNSPIYVHTPSDADIVIKDYDYDVESFSQKGFVNVGFSENSGKLFNQDVRWQKRENPLAAARVIEVVGYSQEGMRVVIDQPDIFACENDSNTTWCIYSETPREVGSNKVLATTDNTSGERIRGDHGNLSTFTFKPSMLTGNVLSISKSDFLSQLPDDSSEEAPTKNYFISPYKYWLYLRYAPKARGNKGNTMETNWDRFHSTNAVEFPKRSYKSIVRTENYLKGEETQQAVGNTDTTTANYTLSAKDTGPTWNETVFNDGKYLNPWSLNFGEVRPTFEQGKDYGFGVFNAEDNIEGGHAFENNVKVGWTEEILPNVVRANNVVPGQKISFMVTPQFSEQNYDFSISSAESSNKPYLLSTFWDEVPVIGFLTVQPDEEYETFPTFNWQVADQKDSWYGFLKIGIDAIYDQYHNKELHIPMNEATTTALTVNTSTTNVTSGNITITREGLAGNAVDFNGTTSYIKYGNGTSDPTGGNINVLSPTTDSGTNIAGDMIAGDPYVAVGDSSVFTVGDFIKIDTEIMEISAINNNGANTIDITRGVKGTGAAAHDITTDVYDVNANCTDYMSVVAHIVPDSGAIDNRYILSQEDTDAEKFYLRLNQYNQVEARVWYSDDGYIEVSSGAIVPSDGYTPSVVILTVDTTAREGNVKLYVNGKLEDQTGVVDSTGTTGNWKTDTLINSGDGYLYVGNSGADLTKAFDGRIEEIVIYKDLIYPVDLSKGIYTLTKPLKEISSNGQRKSYNAVLFVKDYHNIRGEKPFEVAKSHSASFAKSSPAVTGV